MEDKETYTLTPLGLIGAEACDKIILYMVKTDKNAIVFDEGKLHFVKVFKEAENNA